MHRMRSFEKLNYSLRPAKQVERKLLVETLHLLGTAGYPIRDYTYIGFSSVYFVDCLLFHKYLYIDRMISIEREDIPRRMRFNRPYEFIRVRMQPAIELVSTLSRKRPYFVWLDYDRALDLEILDEVEAFSQRLASGSILVVSLDARPASPESEDSLIHTEADRKGQTLRYYQQQFQRYNGGQIEARDLDSRAPRTLARILRGKIQETLLGRPDLEFVQIFNLSYADNAPMLTVGGLFGVTGTERRVRKLLRKLEYVTSGEVPIEIKVPPLTSRERQWLDSNTSKRGKKAPFEMDAKTIRLYRSYSRHYPNYYEAVI